MSRVLLVEDHHFNRRLIRDVLGFRGHEVVEAHDVEQARERLREGRPDVVLLDIQIPGGGGEAVLRTIRETPELTRLPVVAVTALAMSGDRARILALGFDGYISKPIDTKTFASEVEAFIEERGADGG
ncbi:MAG TPA: response regulator [Labilithrix sp.]|jgi:CheY-like chemotaxis protein|nr:response regulator [Labilithrix sp.]